MRGSAISHSRKNCRLRKRIYNCFVKEESVIIYSTANFNFLLTIETRIMTTETSVGERIKYFRTNQKMTLRELAEAVGITPSMLSQIEHDKANPSLNTIRLIARTLNIPIFSLFMADRKEKESVVHAGKRHIISKNDVDYELLTPDMQGGIEFCMLRLGRDRATIESPMAHAGEEVALVLKGVFELHLDGEVFTLHEGDSVRIEPQQIHNWTNVGEGESVLVFAVSPPEF